MDTYTQSKIDMRPQLPNVIFNDSMSPDEIFQNKSLRPILKIQDQLLRVMMKEYIRVKKNTYYNISIEERRGYIKDNILGDRMILNEIRGIVLGLFTADEMQYYVTNKPAINKRIHSLLFQRIMSFLDKEYSDTQ